MIKRILICLSLFIIFGCAVPPIEIQNNTLISEQLPNLNVVIKDKRLQFISEKKETKYINYRDAEGGAIIENQVFIFAEIEDKYVKRAVYIWISKTSSGAWLSDIYGDVNFKIDHGVKKIGGENYQFCTFFYDKILKDVKNAIYDKGYLLEDVYLAHSIGKIFGIDNSGKYHIDYIESVSGMEEKWDKPEKFTMQQKERLQKFVAEANLAFKIN